MTPECHLSGMKLTVVGAIAASIVIVVCLDRLENRTLTDKLMQMVSDTLTTLSEQAAANATHVGDSPNLTATNCTQDKNADLGTVRKFLKRFGYEAAADHEFKSPYIVSPTPCVPRAPTVSTSETKIISCHNCPAWYLSHTFNQHNMDFKRCPYKNCVFDSKGEHRKNATMLLFFMSGLGQKPNRSKGQIWVKAMWESAVHYSYPKPYAPWKDAFNWTFNFRTDSDIFAPNNMFAWRDQSNLLSDAEYAAIARNKTKMAAWFVSNCRSHGRREDYVKQLQKYIDVDIYGACGRLRCVDRNKCEQMLSEDYKFYLSFENSLCQDYVTEKLFRVFQYRTHIVPVVRGGLDYDKHVPPGMVVNTAHFKTIKDLAEHLKHLAGDHALYANMLKEKDKLVTLDRKFDWCDICEKLHTETGTKIIDDIQRWSHGGTCREPADLT
ncbi:unnamed protein product [Lymnaea stagnalis]|uniref:Fucosyltransferase n=1 Tax=Lymnaea stagnalis TaxID=6523 RepID=A0AAV2IR37_LYMST